MGGRRISIVSITLTVKYVGFVSKLITVYKFMSSKTTLKSEQCKILNIYNTLQKFVYKKWLQVITY